MREAIDQFVGARVAQFATNQPLTQEEAPFNDRNISSPEHAQPRRKNVGGSRSCVGHIGQGVCVIEQEPQPIG